MRKITHTKVHRNDIQKTQTGTIISLEIHPTNLFQKHDLDRAFKNTSVRSSSKLNIRSTRELGTPLAPPYPKQRVALSKDTPGLRAEAPLQTALLSSVPWYSLWL
jgi:hypothetical protein